MAELTAVPKPKRPKKAKPKRRTYEELTLNEKKDYLWKAFSRWVRYRDGGVCFTCGDRKDPLKQQAGHYEKSVKGSTRFDPRNVHAQCETCNMWKEGNYREYARRMVAKYGPTILDELAIKANQTLKMTHADVVSLTLEYEALLIELGGTPLSRPKMEHERDTTKT